MKEGKGLDPYRFDHEVVRKTAERIIKDFKGWGVEISFKGNEEDAYRELMSQLTPVIAGFLKNNQQKFMQVLYKIDISEAKLKEAMIKNPSEKAENIISRLIIEREMQKVLTWMIYQKKISGGR